MEMLTDSFLRVLYSSLLHEALWLGGISCEKEVRTIVMNVQL